MNARHVTRVHPTTITAFSQGKIQTRAVQARRTINGKVRTLKVDSRVWKAAMSIANGDAMRIVVKSATEVIVHNRRMK